MCFGNVSSVTNLLAGYKFLAPFLKSDPRSFCGVRSVRLREFSGLVSLQVCVCRRKFDTAN